MGEFRISITTLGYERVLRHVWEVIGELVFLIYVLWLLARYNVADSTQETALRRHG
jgi:hypothetical protein